MRLDILVSRKSGLSRNKSAELIKSKGVLCEGKKIRKPSLEVDEDMCFTLPNTSLYVSRAGEKLEGFLSCYHVNIQGAICLDIGSSTGGFVEILLQKNARKVVAVDVGTGQLHASLRHDKRVMICENTDIRDFSSDILFDVVTCDVSFIGLKDIIDAIDKLAKRDIILLFKPQFEVGRQAKRNKKGVVTDTEAVYKAQENFEAQAEKKKWHLCIKEDSILRGKEGNLEIFYAFRKR